MSKYKIVVVGGGLAAASFVASYREAGGGGFVTMLSAEDRPPYNRPPLSKGFLRGEIDDETDTYVKPPAFYEEQVVGLRLGCTVAAVDVEAQHLTLANCEQVPYDRLVIATGATPKTPPLEGIDLPAVHVYRTLADALAVRDAAAEARKALVIGGSFIGSEVGASLRRLGLDVVIVEAADRLVPQLSSGVLSAQVADLYREHGVDLLLNDSVAELRANGQSLVGAVTRNGERIEVDLAVLGVGVRPATGFLEGSGIELDDGIVVDERFRTSAENVYAVGDVARFPDRVFGHARRIEHWTNAKAQGEHLGRALAGSRAMYKEVPVFFTELFGRKLQVLGDLDGGVDDVVLHGSLASGRLLGYYLREGKLVGAVLSGQERDVAAEVNTLLRAQPVAPGDGRLLDESLRPTVAFAT